MKAFVAVCLLALVVLDSALAGTRFASRKPSAKKGTPFVTFYENDHYRGKDHIETFKTSCVNLPKEYENWASSIDTHKRCIDVCDQLNCEGTCARIYPANGVNINMSLKLDMVGMNDKISSFKSCYTIMPSRS